MPFFYIAEDELHQATISNSTPAKVFLVVMVKRPAPLVDDVVVADDAAIEAEAVSVVSVEVLLVTATELRGGIDVSEASVSVDVDEGRSPLLVELLLPGSLVVVLESSEEELGVAVVIQVPVGVLA